MEHPVLFRKSSKGKIQQWKVWTEVNTIFTEYGVMDGKLQVTSKEIQGKNIGRSNETTPTQQAESEAQSMWQKRVDGKYRQTLEETEEVVYLPMLANDYTKLKKPLEYPVDVQPKLDGVRSLSQCHDQKTHLMSRGGKDYSVAHIQEQVAKILPESVTLDGELYIHGMALQDIIRLVKKHRDGPLGSALLQLHVYDCFEDPDMPWSERKELLNSILTMKALETAPSIFFHPTYTVHNEEELYNYLAAFEQGGYEGLIIRKLDGVYRLGHRSKDLLKLKNFLDTEYEIVGFTHGSGRDKDTVIWTCKTESGKEFGARPIGTREQRKEWFREGNKYIGKLLTVKYQALTKDGLPQFPVGIVIRDYE